MKALALILCLFSILAFSQTQKESYQQQQNQYQQKVEKVEPITVYIPWTCENEGYWGSFWWKVTKQKVDKSYYYTVYVFSNSYFNIKDSLGYYRKAITKVTDCAVWAKDYEEEEEFSIGSVVFDWQSTYLFQFTTDDPKPVVAMRYTNVSPYDYSKIK